MLKIIANIYLNKMKLILLFIGFTGFSSFASLYGQNGISTYKKDEYKAYYIALLIEKFRPDTIWRDGISCAMPDDLDEIAVREIDSLVSVSIENLWSQSDIRSDYKGDRETWALDVLCLAYELLDVLSSNQIDVLATAYAEREKENQINRRK